MPRASARFLIALKFAIVVASGILFATSFVGRFTRMMFGFWARAYVMFRFTSGAGILPVGMTSYVSNPPSPRFVSVRFVVFAVSVVLSRSTHDLLNELGPTTHAAVDEPNTTIFKPFGFCPV